MKHTQPYNIRTTLHWNDILQTIFLIDKLISLEIIIVQYLLQHISLLLFPFCRQNLFYFLF